MCRVLSYLGEPILAEELLYNPDNSFIKQSYEPKHMSHLLNLAGFGMIAWDPESINSNIPYIYKTPRLPFFDENLRNLSAKIKPQCFLAHIRGVSYNEKQVVSTPNVHPFIFRNSNIALAHNGVLRNFNAMKFDLLDYIKPEFSKNIRGTTDSEWIYALFLSQLTTPLDEKNISEAILKTFKILQKIRQKHDIFLTSPTNLFISDGKFLAATRFALDFGWQPLDSGPDAHIAYHSLWYTYGENYGYYEGEYRMKNSKNKRCIIIASEPLTEDTTTWMEIPEYSLIIAWCEEGEIKVVTQDIVL